MLMSEPTEPKTNIKSLSTDKYYTFAKEVCEGLTGQDYIYCLEEDKYFIYKDGYWQNIYESELIKSLGEHKFKIKTKDGVTLVTINKYTIHARKQVIENIKYINDFRITKLNTLPFINLENYMFDAIGVNVLKHDKKYYSTTRIPYKYDALAKCPLWDKTLTEIFEDDKKKHDLFQEFIGYCLIPDVKQKKAMLLLGESDSGKSTLLFIIRDLIGDINCSSVPLKYLAHPQYTPLLINKLVNIDADVDKNAQDYEAEFKKITTGEKVSCNQKHIPTFEFVPQCKIIMAANIFPRITDHSSAFYTRLILIPCDRVFKEHEKNRNLADQLRQELPGILNWAIEGLKRLQKRGHFEVYNFMRDAIDDLEDENNPANVFFKEHVNIDITEGTYIEKPVLFEKYKNWCRDNEQRIITHIMFSRCVIKKYSKYVDKDSRLTGNGARIWRNIRYVDRKIVEPVKHEVNWQDNEPPGVVIPDNDQPSLSKQGDINWEA